MNCIQLLRGGWFALLPLLLCPNMAGSDPMRPLAVPAAPAPPAARVAHTGASAAADNRPTMAPTPAAAARRLVAIRENDRGERTALFGERWVRTGDRYASPDGETVVLRISASSIEIEQARSRSTYYLVPPLLPVTGLSRPALRPEPPHANVAQPSSAAANPAARPGGATASTPIRTEKP